MENRIKLSVVIPTYNEAGNIERLLLETSRILKKAHVPHEFIIVDDGSYDETRKIVRKLQETMPEIVLVERDNERGLASAMIRGYNTARGRYFGSMDADLAHNPTYLLQMVNILDSRKADFVIGSRYVAEARFEGKPILNRVASIIGQCAIKLILGINIKDTSNNYRIFRGEIWDKIKGNLHPDGNIMLTEIVYRAVGLGAIIREIPTIYVERREGKSKLSVFKETRKFFKNILKIRFSK